MTHSPTLSRRHLLGLIAAVPVVLASPLVLRSARAATPGVYGEDGIAIDGTDAVAYRTQGGPVAGSADFAFDWNGATWHFSSAETREMFISDPDYYAPAYGGYCAFAVSQGYTASTVPEAWTIHDDRLFLNFSRRVKRRWERDIPGNVVKGDANWPDVLA
jgi:YHS domain-containing protein